jgi:hypothetical protein
MESDDRRLKKDLILDRRASVILNMAEQADGPSFSFVITFRPVFIGERLFL